MTELTTVVQIVTVEQTRGCRGRGDNQEREDRNRGWQPYGETDEPGLHGTMSGFNSGLTKRRSGSGIELSPFISKASIIVNQATALGNGLPYVPQRALAGRASAHSDSAIELCEAIQAQAEVSPPQPDERHDTPVTPHPDAARHKAIRNSRNRFATATSAPAFHLRSARSRYEEELSSPDR